MAVDEELAPLKGADTSGVPKLDISEIGYNALSVISGRVLEECDPNLRWPYCVNVYKKMMHDDVIASSVEMFNILLTKAPWYVDAPDGKEEELAPLVKYFSTIKDDMEHSWLSFMKQASSYVHMGFATHEIVLGYRLRKEGSKYNDGLVRVRKLVLRKQDSITGWEFKNKGRDLSGLWQAVNKPQGKWNYKRNRNIEDNTILSDKGITEQFIPREKFLLFRNNSVSDSPEGVSPLKSIYRLWKYRTAYEEAEAVGTSTDVHGLKVLYIPPEYMTPDATDENKEVYETYKKIMRNIHVGQESGLILPMYRDDIKGDKLFEFEIVNSTGQKAYDIGSIINRCDQRIRTALYSDFLTLGQNGGGSYAQSENKESFVQTIANSKLEEIRDVLNHHLIPMICRKNYEITKNEIWNTEVFPTFEFGAIDKLSIAEFAKAAYQLLAAGGIRQTAKNMNHIGNYLHFPDPFPEDYTVEDVREELSGNQTRAADGFATTGDGTSKSPSGKDSSASNAANK